MQICLLGAGGGQWRLSRNVSGEIQISASTALSSDSLTSEAAWTTSTFHWARLLSGDLSVDDALNQGVLLFESANGATEQCCVDELSGTLQLLGDAAKSLCFTTPANAEHVKSGASEATRGR